MKIEAGKKLKASFEAWASENKELIEADILERQKHNLYTGPDHPGFTKLALPHVRLKLDIDVPVKELNLMIKF